MLTTSEKREKITKMITELIDMVDEYRCRIAEKYFTTLHQNGIEDDDAVFDVFDNLCDGDDDLDRMVDDLMEVSLLTN